jgi:hypothetical protein
VPVVVAEQLQEREVDPPLAALVRAEAAAAAAARSHSLCLNLENNSCERSNGKSERIRGREGKPRKVNQHMRASTRPPAPSTATNTHQTSRH